MSTQELLVGADTSTSCPTCRRDRWVRSCMCLTIQCRRDRELGRLHTGKTVAKSRQHSSYLQKARPSGSHHFLCKPKLQWHHMRSHLLGTCMMAQFRLLPLFSAPFSSRSTTQIPVLGLRFLKLCLLRLPILVHQSWESPLHKEVSLPVDTPIRC